MNIIEKFKVYFFQKPKNNDIALLDKINSLCNKILEPLDPKKVKRNWKILYQLRRALSKLSPSSLDEIKNRGIDVRIIKQVLISSRLEYFHPKFRHYRKHGGFGRVYTRTIVHSYIPCLFLDDKSFNIYSKNSKKTVNLKWNDFINFIESFIFAFSTSDKGPSESELLDFPISVNLKSEFIAFSKEEQTILKNILMLLE